MKVIRSIVIGSFAWAAITGCGEASPAPGEQAESPASTEKPGNLATVEQSVNEASCGTTAPDRVVEPASPKSAVRNHTFGTASTYGHPSCQNGYVLELTNVVGPEQDPTIEAAYGGPTLADPFSCAFSWLTASLWQKQGSTYVKVDQKSSTGVLSFGSLGGSLPYIYCAAPYATFKPPAAGDYKIVAAAGELFTYEPIQFYTQDYLTPPDCSADVGSACTEPLDYCQSGTTRISGTYVCSGGDICRPSNDVCQGCDNGNCGKCAGQSCKADTECAPGSSCNPSTKTCTAVAGCTPRLGYCYAPTPTFGLPPKGSGNRDSCQ